MSKEAETNRERRRFKERLHEIIFGTDSPVGKGFDVALLWLILLSVTAVSLESVESIQLRYSGVLVGLEWLFTLVFTVEYLARLYCVRNRKKYVFSFFGIIDLLAILPTYLEFFLEGSHYLIAIRVLRLIRVFRVLKLIRFMREGNVLLEALKMSRHKITVFMASVVTLVVVMGTLMYIIEGPENGFTSIPRGVYWAIVTLSTVGYGDITPQTPLGQMIACIVMITGYAVIAVPTGIVSVELQQASRKALERLVCSTCKLSSHDEDASYCKGCGDELKRP